MMRYRKFLVALLAAAACILPATAETVSQKEAKQVARLFFNDAYGEVCEDPVYVYNGKRLTTDRLFTPFYVFNSPKGGFVIVSAENKAFPILGYSLSRPKFPQQKELTAEQTQLLRNYARDIELVRYDSRPALEATAQWQALPSTIHSTLYSPSVLPESHYRFRPTEESVWVLRERAVEFPYEWPKTDAELEAERESDIEEAYVPFSLFDDFVALSQQEEREREARLEERIRPSKPVVRNLGGAHFTIDFPNGIDMVLVYNSEGALLKRQYHRNDKTVNLDLSNLPTGFYFARFIAPSGESHGLKLWR